MTKRYREFPTKLKPPYDYISRGGLKSSTFVPFTTRQYQIVPLTNFLERQVHAHIEKMKPVTGSTTNSKFNPIRNVYDHERDEVHGLTLRFVVQCRTMWMIAHNADNVISRSKGEIPFYDYLSVITLYRSLLELFVILFHVFMDAASDDEFKFRYYFWKYEGFCQHKKASTKTSVAKSVLRLHKQHTSYSTDQKRRERTLKLSSSFLDNEGKQLLSLFKRPQHMPRWLESTRRLKMGSLIRREIGTRCYIEQV